MDKNPFIEPENYFAGYQKSIDGLKNNPDAIRLDKLTYEALEHSEAGRAFMKVVEERFLIPPLVSRGNPTYQIDVLWQEGFKDAFRMLKQCIVSHQQRIKAGNK